MTIHADFAQLCDYLDNELERGDRAHVDGHLRDCADCRAWLAALSGLAQHVDALPSEHVVPPDLWRGIRAGLSPREATQEAAGRGYTGQMLAAAALIAIISSALTVITLQGTRLPRGAAAPTVATSAQAAALAQGAPDELRYVRSAGVLQETLAQRRDSLAPSTVATVERSLRVADSAIAEARLALASDPANRILARLLASNYERKIDLLRRANELAPRT